MQNQVPYFNLSRVFSLIFSTNNHQRNSNEHTKWDKTDQINGKTVNNCSDGISNRFASSATIPHCDLSNLF